MQQPISSHRSAALRGCLLGLAVLLLAPSAANAIPATTLSSPNRGTEFIGPQILVPQGPVMPGSSLNPQTGFSYLSSTSWLLLRAQVRIQAASSRLIDRHAVKARQIALAKSRSGAITVAGDINNGIYGWSDLQIGCLVQLWDHESNWNYRSINRTSGAHGIAQALPGVKMSTAGSDWRSNPVTQIKWGMGYIKARYATPCNALGHWRISNWY